jgi:hypothetical protein
MFLLFSFSNVSLIQTEIDTHLHVLHINLNTNYNGMTDTSTVLNAMRDIYGSDVGWHYTSPSGIKPDLHHALLGESIGGGKAGVGVICDPARGFGMSSSLKGNFVSMDNAVVWDISVVSSTK